MSVSDRERRVLDKLDALAIAYTRIEHPAVYTVDQARTYWSDQPGTDRR